jgi:hypothetical protein
MLTQTHCFASHPTTPCSRTQRVHAGTHARTQTYSNDLGGPLAALTENELIVTLALVEASMNKPAPKAALLPVWLLLATLSRSLLKMAPPPPKLTALRGWVIDMRIL